MGANGPNLLAPPAGAPALGAAAPTSGGGGLNLLAAPGGGGGVGLPPVNDPVASAESQNQKYLGMIEQSGNQQAIQQAKEVAAGTNQTHTGSWLSSLVRTLDLPRAAVVSGIDTAVHGGGLSQWLKGTENHETTGHLLNDLGIHNHWVDSIGGIVGDVALDPLTYVGGVGDIGRAAAVTGHVVDAVSKADDAARAADIADKMGTTLKAAEATGADTSGIAAEHAASLAEADQKAADAAEATGNGTINADTLVRLKTQGLGGLNDAERSFLEEAHPDLGSLHTGIGVRVPGSKIAGRPTYIPLAHTDALSSALKGFTNRVADTRAMTKAEQLFVPHGELNSMIRSAALNGEGDRVAALSQIKRVVPEAEGTARQVVNYYGPHFAAAKSEIPSEVHDLVPAALEGATAAQQAIHDAGGDEGLAHLQNTYAQLRQEAADTGVPMGNIENYFPHQLTDAARDTFARRGGGVSARKAFGSELQRTYKAGSTFLGHELETGSVAEMNQIAHDEFGKDAFDLFRSDPWTVTNSYLHGMAKRIGQQHVANRLDDLGVTASGDRAFTPEEWQGLLNGYKSVLGQTVKRNSKQAARADNLSENLGVASGTTAAVPQSAKGTLATMLTKKEGDFVKGALKNLGVQPESGKRFNLSQLVQHSDELRSLLGEESEASRTAAQRASEGLKTVKEASHQPSEDLVSLGNTGADAGRLAPPYVKEALQKLAEEQSQGAKGSKFFGWYDKALNVWKQYALAMPGKAIRHTVATPGWGMYLGNVGLGNMRDGMSAWRAFQRGGLDAVKDGGMRDEIQSFLDQGVAHGHDFHSDTLTGPQTRTAKLNATIHNPLSTKSAYFRKNQDFQRAAQDYSRFAMYHDAIQKGAAPAEAAAKVRQFLGDPHVITNFERSTARRVVPFYTFLRQNMPVELKALATQPGKFVNAYQAPKQEVEQYSSPQQLVPEFFKDTMSVRLPLKFGGNQVYLSPDLPFTRIGSLFSGKNQLISQTSPLIQDIAAVLENQNTFTGSQFSPYAKQAPGAWEKIPGLMQLLHAIAPHDVLQAQKTSTDYGVTTPAGAWEMTPKVESLIESLVPPLAQARRAVPTEPNMKARGDTTLMADLLGQNFRTNDPSQQSIELYNRQAALKSMIEQLQNEGDLPRYIYGFHA